MAFATAIENFQNLREVILHASKEKTKQLFISANDIKLIILVYNILERRVRTLSTPCIVQKKDGCVVLKKHDNLLRRQRIKKRPMKDHITFSDFHNLLETRWLIETHQL